ncbi:MAG: ASPIC/UnbV domain-containing protein [Archangium sp.]|nr:ASPIC/UnbV domain-containing protein [Archangium sp.]
MAQAGKQMADARSEYSPSLLGGATQSFSGWEPKKLWLSRTGASEECAWTEGFDSRSDGRSLIASDLDDDGDIDLLMLNRNTPRLQLFRNDGESGQAVRLRFTPASGVRDAANVTARIDGRAEEILLNRGFASSVPPELVRGVGAAKTAQVDVTWRSGKRQRFMVPAGNTSTLSEATGKVLSVPFAARTQVEPPRFPITLDALDLPVGKPTLVTLFLAGCAPCKKEAPALNALMKSGRYDVRGLGVASSLADAQRIAKQLGYAFPVLPLPSFVGEALSINGQLNFPTTLLYGADGKLERILTELPRAGDGP